MKKSSYFYTGLLVGLFVLTLWFMYWLGHSPYFFQINNWIAGNIILYVFILFVYKALGILWPPIPAGIFTLASIPFLGWVGAYFVDLVGSVVGGSIAYYLGRRYGITLLRKIFDEKILKKIKKVRIKRGREVEAVIIYRILLGTTILEVLYYGAGFLKIDFGKFLIGAILSHIVVGIPVFFFAQSVFSGKNVLISVILSVITLFFVLKTKGRYFE